MRMKTVKAANEIRLAGISVELEIVDGVIKGCTLIDGDRGVARFTIRNWSDFHVEIPEPPTMVERFIVRGSMFDASITKTLKTSGEAHVFAEQIRSVGGVAEIESAQVADDVPAKDTGRLRSRTRPGSA